MKPSLMDRIIALHTPFRSLYNSYLSAAIKHAITQYCVVQEWEPLQQIIQASTWNSNDSLRSYAEDEV